MSNLVTVAVFMFPQDMAVVRARMEWEGIACFVRDENVVAAHPLYSNAVGGIKLQVLEADVQRATELLIEVGILVPDPQAPMGAQGFWHRVAEGFRLPRISPATWRKIGWGILAGVVVAWILFL